MTRFAIGIGSNVGDRIQHLIDAHLALQAEFEVTAVSSVYETEPIGGPEQDPFLNAVILVETELAPPQLLEACVRIESAQGRERTVRWGPRTVDLDILTSDGPRWEDPDLSIPHPRAVDREFVLRPLAEVWPDAPVAPRRTAASALDDVGDQGVDFLSSDWLPPVSSWRAKALLAGQFGLIIAVAMALAYDGSLPQGAVTASRVLGGLLAFAGAVLAFVASRRLGSAMTASPIPKRDATLVIAGPYRYARHPIYGGISLFLVGTALLLDSTMGLVIAALLVPYFLFKARYEERQLRMRYAGYLLYRQTVRRWLIPFVI